MRQNLTNRLNKFKYAVQTRLLPNRGEGYVDTLVKILIGIVLGALLLSLLTGLLTLIFPQIQDKIQELFGLGGSASSVAST